MTRRAAWTGAAMPLEVQKYELVLSTLGQHDAPQKSVPGELEVCSNATFPKAGRIDKRRGYSRVEVGVDIEDEAIAPDSLTVNVAVSREELLVVGYDTLYAVLDREGQVGGGALVRRGPTLRGNMSTTSVATSRLSDS